MGSTNGWASLAHQADLGRVGHPDRADPAGRDLKTAGSRPEREVAADRRRMASAPKCGRGLDRRRAVHLVLLRGGGVTGRLRRHPAPFPTTTLRDPRKQNQPVRKTARLASNRSVAIP